MESASFGSSQILRPSIVVALQKVTSGVPQRSILGPMLCVVFINNIDSFVVSSLLKFADDTKTLRQVPEVEYVFTLQEYLHSMYKWSQD